MNALPWLVVHGAAVWQAGLFLFTLGGLGLTRLRPRLAARSAARAALARLGAVEETPARLTAGARVTLEGALVAGEALAARYEDGGEAAAASMAAIGAGRAALTGSRADRLSLVVGDAVIRLDGPIEVVVGSREAWPSRALRRLPAAIGMRVAGAPPGVVPVFRSVAPGDRARVSGVLCEEASDDGTTYRDAAKRWTLTAAGHDDALLLAHVGAPRVSGPAPAAFAAPALLAPLAFLVVFGVGGEVAMSVARRQLEAVRFADAVHPRALSLAGVEVAAATPLRRDDALAAYLEALDARRDADPSALATRAALHAQRGEAAEVAAMWIAQGEPSRGAGLAEEARQPALAARGWYLDGEFARAAEAWERQGTPELEAEARFGVVVELLAGNLDKAARATRRLEARLRDHAADDEPRSRWYAARAETARCLADALDARRGDGEAWRSLHAEAPGPLSHACAALRLDLFEGAERTAALHALPPLARTADTAPSAWIELLAAEADPEHATAPAPAFDDPTWAALVPNGGALAGMLPAVERRLAEALEARGAIPRALRASRARVTASAAMFALLAGDDAGARRLALLHVADVNATSYGTRHLIQGGCIPYKTPHFVDALGALVDVAAGDPAAPPSDGGAALLFAYRQQRDPRGLLALLVERPPPDEDEKRAWQLAAAGDGASLADWLGRPTSQPGTFLRFGAPLVTDGRDALARWVRWGYRPPGGARPTEALVHLADLAAAAEALGEAETGRLLRERARRFREAVLRRETAVPLAVLERL